MKKKPDPMTIGLIAAILAFPVLIVSGALILLAIAVRNAVRYYRHV